MSREFSIRSTTAAHLLRRCAQQADDLFSRSVGPIDITARQLSVLSAVAQLNDPSQTRLCEVTGIDRSTLADIVRRLVGRGWLSRHRTTDDARMYAVQITAEGRTTLEQASPIALKVNNLLLSPLSSDEQTHFQSLLQKIVHASDRPQNNSPNSEVGTLERFPPDLVHGV